MITTHKLLCVLIVLTVLLLPTSFCNKSVFAQPASIPGAEERDRGIDLYRKAKFIEAALVLKQAVEKNKADEQSWYYLGLALTKKPQELKEASKAFETALRLKPRFAAAHAGLSYTLLKREKFSEALREAKLALALEPGIANAHYIVSVIRLNNDEYEDAAKEAREAIRLNSSLAPAYLVLSEAVVGIYGRQFQNMSRATGPDKPMTPEQLAEARQQRRERQAPLKEAADSLETYLRLNPSEPASDLWQRQLTNLRIFADAGEQPFSEAIKYGFEVTSKARVLEKPEPPFTEAARKARVGGTVILQAVLGADGTVRNILILKALPYGLTESAILAARQIKFAPALIDGQPVSMFVQLEYNFYI